MGKAKRKQLKENASRKLITKAAFSRHISSLSVHSDEEIWECCSTVFPSMKDIHKHVALNHIDKVQQKAKLLQFSEPCKKIRAPNADLCLSNTNVTDFKCSCVNKGFQVLLFYHYVSITCCQEVCTWQKDLGSTLKLTGKIRIASEGINGTVEGCQCATNIYKNNILGHPLFIAMTTKDFKSSKGNGQSFDNLSVSVCPELCTIGIPCDSLKASNGGKYLSPEELHQTMENLQKVSSDKKDPLLLDCRNFYESKIGYFEGALKPDLRKFSYFPEYVDSNKNVFNGRKVIMYCTGGIRCERASAYLKQATNCEEVYQLKGGIHRYMEKYPTGYFKGKLFVFDNRYSIGGQDSSVVSNCQYCNKPHDSYQLCSTQHCRQLVLICEKCRNSGHTTCCLLCKKDAAKVSETKQCTCTRNRLRIPVEHDS
uniref:Thiosulfate sulfurtransferase/rhodanese-like domain-containing protein 2 n=1 Tax=Phallusia mammillata TaxID=59560 RepID=A0A6F9DWA3_9ASCI|nr:thiosulfate sulfurtransferase/rhodanese-like domain-containing protein 2 [Phallusia mammillata]